VQPGTVARRRRRPPNPLNFLERIVREAEDFPDVDATFERRLALVLDGLAAGIERRRPPARSPG
jgi:hypothetical protein